MLSLSRPLVPPGAFLRRAFHRTAAAAAAEASHYETLQVPPTASAAEIKSAFYHLSKLSHPDRNPADPSASDRFVTLSNAYATLRSPDKRARYDRDVLRLHQQRRAPSQPAAHTPAGGRAPSGLSTRRGTFRGPPPSFYRSGGWGEQSAKRRAAHEGAYTNTNTNTNTYPNSPPGSAAGAEPAAGGMGPGQTPFGHFDPVRHFDRASRLRTHAGFEARRRERGAAAAAGMQQETAPGGEGMWGNFVLVGGLIAAGVVGPWWVFEYLGKGRGGMLGTGAGGRRREGGG